MYLAIMLIMVSILVFYNEVNNKMNIAEILLLAISLIAISRASLNYINMSDTPVREGFEDTIKLPNKSNSNSKQTGKSKLNTTNKLKKKENIINLTSDKNTAIDYFNTDTETRADNTNTNTITDNMDIKNKNNNKNNNNKDNNNKNNNNKDNNKQHINNDAVNQINSILGHGISQFSQFDDIPEITKANTQQPIINNDEIESIFKPQIIIGKGANDSTTSSQWNNTSNSNDNMTFNKTMNPTHNLWSNDDDYNNNGNSNSSGSSSSNGSGSSSSNGSGSGSGSGSNNTQTQSNNNMWNRNLDDYNNGKWDPKSYNKPSENNYTDYYTPTQYGMNTPNSQPQSQEQTMETTSENTKKKCGEYNDLSDDKSGNLVVREYKDSKKWYPGYTYVPPVHWDVPQKRADVCLPNEQNYTKLTGLIDRGLPINVLELNQNGNIAHTEDTVLMSNVGSMIPRFNYQEQPFSKPYV